MVLRNARLENRARKFLRHDHAFEVESSALISENARQKADCNLRALGPRAIGISLDETTTARRSRALDVDLSRHARPRFCRRQLGEPPIRIPQSAIRNSEFLTHPVFNTHDTETEMLRYLQKARIARSFADHLDDPARLVHDEVERDRGNVPDFVAGNFQAPSVRARRPNSRLSRDVRAARKLARGNHRLRRGFTAAERRIAGRIRGPARDSRISRFARRSASQRLPHPDLRPRNEPGQRSHGWFQGRAGRLLERWRHRSRRSARQSRSAQSTISPR